MKKVAPIFFIAAQLIYCKTNAEPDGKDSIPLSMEIKKKVSVKIHCIEFNCTNYGNTYSSGDLIGVNFSENTNNRFMFSEAGFLKPEINFISKTENLNSVYQKNVFNYPGKDNLTPTYRDKSANETHNKFRNIFNCAAHVNNAFFYNFTEGILNINIQ